MDDNASNRLKLFIDNRGMTSSQFADRCGIPRPTLSMILSGRNKKISDALLRLIHTAFPDLSISWLLFGEGMMYVSNVTPSDNNVSQEPDNLFSLDEDKGIENNSILTPFNHVPEIAADRIESCIADEIKNAVSSIKIENSSRKVTRITIFYDDSTFETFFPESMFGGTKSKQ